MIVSEFDGKKFVISTPVAGPSGFYDGGWIAPQDGSAPARRIMGWSFGGYYDLDDGSGKSENSIRGPWTGAEIIEFIAKRGGEEAGSYSIPRFPGWTNEQCESPIILVCGPNNGPYTPDMKIPLVTGAPSVPPPPAVAIQASPVVPPATQPTASPVDQGQFTLPAPQAAPVTPKIITPAHLTMIARIESWITQLRRELEG